MNQSFFTGAVAAHQQLKRLTVYGNNIANLNTYGFKSERARFAALMYDDVKNADEEMLPVGVGTCLWTTDTNFNPGPVAETGRKQDYLIEGDGFFALVDLQTNEVSLTRSGAFTIAELLRPTGEVDAEGQPVEERIMYLADGDGRFVLSETGGMIEVDDFNAQYPVGIFDYINYNDAAERHPLYAGGQKRRPAERKRRAAAGDAGNVQRGLCRGGLQGDRNPAGLRHGVENGAGVRRDRDNHQQPA